MNPNIGAALIGAAVTIALGALPFLVGWGSLRTAHDALKERVHALEVQIGAITQVKEDVAYMRGVLDTLAQRLDDLSGWFQSPPPITPTSRKPRP